jgi:hypothetical protein
MQTLYSLMDGDSGHEGVLCKWREKGLTPQSGWLSGKDISSTTRYAWCALCGVTSAPAREGDGVQLSVSLQG